MAESFVQVAPDSTGAKMRTVAETVGANTVHQQVVIPTSPRTRTGMYRGYDGVAAGQAILATAHTALATTAGTGFLFLTNPVGSSVGVAVKRLQLSFGATAGTTMPTSPRIVVTKFQFTGTISTTGLTVSKRVTTTVAGQTADAANVAKLTIAITGQTTTATQPIRAWLVPCSILTTSGILVYGPTLDWNPDTEDDEVILAAGEGIAVQQLDNGTASDVRKVALSAVWEEFTAP